MALTECHECGRSVSEGALVCPQCGVARLDQLEKPSFIKLFGPWIIAFVVVFLLLMLLF